MKMKKILEDNGWIVECESPFEIRHEITGDFASGFAAICVLSELKEQNKITIPNRLTKQDLKTYTDYLTVGKLKEFIKKHNLKDDAIVVVQRVEDRYYENNGWGVYLKEGEQSWSAKQWNYDIEKGEYLDKEQYPDIAPENLHTYTEEQLIDTMEQYHPVWSCVRYSDEGDDILFLDLHY